MPATHCRHRLNPPAASLVVALVLGFTGGWYYIDRRSRARHGGYRVY